LHRDEATMRWIYLVIVILFVAASLILVFQNLGVVTMSFLGFSVRAPLAILAVVVYVLGALTGGSLYALLRHSLRESKARSETRP
jgi:lipopolysaccharide assembly protein A